MDSGSASNLIGDVRAVWESLAQSDPLWAILSAPDKKGNEWNLEEFFQTGAAQIDQLMQTLRHHEISYCGDAVLDFGCGVGRLSQAFLPYFASVSGVDVSPTMIKMARELNRDPARCHYFLNQEEDLKLFQDHQFSFIYSIIVLQHLPPDLAFKYLAEFIRILRPDGLLVFQLPSRFVQEQELTSAAFSAIIACRDAPASVVANQILELRVEVENSTSVPWNYHEPFTISLGNHWLSPDGTVRIRDDGRTPLPSGLLLGQRLDVPLRVKAPEAPGTYLLELDIVQEGISWFKDKGSKTCSIEVKVLEPPRSEHEQMASTAPVHSALQDEKSDSPVSAPEPHFAMHCIPRPKVLDFLRELGCRLEFMETSGLGGIGTLSYLYYVRKPRNGPRIGDASAR